jgi:LuxR family transcriptional regulator, maltose regulon positive regulatory protein
MLLMGSSASILATKLYAPALRSRLVLRPRLVQQLLPIHPLTLIVAPAGFGKTTLVGAWIAQTDYPVAWLSLDADDNDLARFLMYAIAALRTVAPDLGADALALLQSPQSVSPQIVLTALINDVSALFTPWLLVLDDYHVIETNAVHEAITFLLDHRPPHLHLVITSRTDPPLPLARWRVRDLLTEVRSNDLRFTLHEAEAFLNQVMGLQLSAHAVATLEQRTEGWIAGLQLAALSLRGRHDVAGFIQTFSGNHPHVLGYLVDEVLVRQPEAVLNFLLHTSILERLCAPLCDALTGQSSSHTLLAQLERANLFIVPLDDQSMWYRYHHLFAEVLRQRLQHTWPERWWELHQRASTWHEVHGTLREAVAHALAMPDFIRAVRLIAQNFTTLWVRGELTTLLQWLKALPEVELRAHPQGNIAYAWTLAFLDQTDAAEVRLRLAEEVLRETLDEEGAARNDLWGQAIALRARLAARRGEWQTAIDLAEEALARLLAECCVSCRCVLLASGCLSLEWSARRGDQRVEGSEQFRMGHPELPCGDQQRTQ